MSLGKPFYATEYRLYTGGIGTYWKLGEDQGRLWNNEEAYGNVWKSLENARTVHR